MRCKECGRRPDEIDEYIDQANILNQYYSSPNDFVRKEEGTFNRITELFYCTDCYIKIGMPLGKA